MLRGTAAYTAVHPIRYLRFSKSDVVRRCINQKSEFVFQLTFVMGNYFKLLRKNILYYTHAYYIFVATSLIYSTIILRFAFTFRFPIYFSLLKLTLVYTQFCLFIIVSVVAWYIYIYIARIYVLYYIRSCLQCNIVFHNVRVYCSYVGINNIIMMFAYFP